MGERTVPPGGGPHDPDDQHGSSAGDTGDVRQQAVGEQGDTMSYSDKLKTNVRLDQRLKRYLREISLEKTDTDAENEDVEEEDIARVFKTLGIDIDSRVR